AQIRNRYASGLYKDYSPADKAGCLHGWLGTAGERMSAGNGVAGARGAVSQPKQAMKPVRMVSKNTVVPTSAHSQMAHPTASAMMTPTAVRASRRAKPGIRESGFV